MFYFYSIFEIVLIKGKRLMVSITKTIIFFGMNCESAAPYSEF